MGHLGELARNTQINLDPTVTGGGYVYGSDGPPGVFMGYATDPLQDLIIWLHELGHKESDTAGPWPDRSPGKEYWWKDMERTANRVAASHAWDRQPAGPMANPNMPYPFDITSYDPWQQGVDVIREHPGMATNYFYPRGPLQIPGAAMGSEPKQEFLNQGPEWGGVGELYAQLIGQLLGNRHLIPPPLQRFFPGVPEMRPPNTPLLRPYDEWAEW